MGQTLYFECYSGISGDMVVASLLDLGANQEILLKGLQSLNLTGYKINITRVKKSSIDACDFDVVLEKESQNRDHDMEYLHSHKEHHLSCNEESPFCHHHRNLQDILLLIKNAEISDRAKSIAKNIFTILAEAEAIAHGTDITDVHFHEVGAIDSILDIVGTAICIDNLNITSVVVKELYEGQGIIRCQHGFIPIPVPAVINIVQKYDLNIHITNIKGELITPTGAAIVASVKTTEELPEKFTIRKLGIGAGKRTYPTPGILRAMLIDK